MSSGTPIRTKTGKKVWASWDCPVCGYANIHGSKRECPGCGRPRGIQTQYNIKPGKIEYLTEEEAQSHQKPDWMCECCDSYNSDTLQVCKSCGAPRGASKDYFEVRRQQKEQEVEKEAERLRSQGFLIEKDAASKEDEVLASLASSEEDSDWHQRYRPMGFYESSAGSSNRKPPDNRNFLKSGRWKGLFTGIFVVLAIISVVGLGIKLFSPKPVSFTIESKSWEYSIEIEELKTLKGEGWDPPSDARILKEDWIVKEKDKEVFDHYKTVETEVLKSTVVKDPDFVTIEYEDDGNGALDEVEVRIPQSHTEYYTDTEETQEAVYRYEDVYAWYYWYEYDRWTPERYIKTSGSEDSKPYWGTYTLGVKEREGTRSKSYSVSVTEEDEKKSYTIKEGIWFDLQVGDEVTAKVNVLGGITEILTVNGVEYME